MKFKKGDIIVCIKEYSTSIFIGDKFKITENYNESDSRIAVEIVILRGKKSNGYNPGSLVRVSVEQYYVKENSQLELEF